MKRLLIAIVALIAIADPALAKHRHHASIRHIEQHGCVYDNNGRVMCSGTIQRIHNDANGNEAYAKGEQVIGGRPSGCPHAYCGCAAARYLGIQDARLNLAWNWVKYYTGSVQVAVWRHHIAIIEKWTGPNTAILRDYNSGHGLSRIHERNIAGARIVGGNLARL